MLVYSGNPCSSARYVMDNNVREVRDQPTLEGGEYDHEMYALSEDLVPSAVRSFVPVLVPLFEGAPPAAAQKAILVGPADVVGTLWRRKMCDILETRENSEVALQLLGPRQKGRC